MSLVAFVGPEYGSARSRVACKVRSGLFARGTHASMQRRSIYSGIITPSTKLMTHFSRRRIGRGVRENNSSPSWALPE